MKQENTDQKSHKFFVELTSLINRHSVDSKAGTPDYVLAEYMIGCLKTFCQSLENRMVHIYGKPQKKGNTWTEDEVERLVEYLVPGMNSMVLINDFRQLTHKTTPQ